ncbi:hypothetical protein QBC47DRAFT_139142 [Echria macrotheca]|uniref:Uncharacterized protein n=1 Tax=Echria macrotheca TaxID=438768 RepID=A0AAJ0BJJ2_9PEZI|nr:hypothetical protein QBC47DRAFT_139142 [Echria macrotheca]
MTSAMTKLPSDSFWPAGAGENEVRLPFPNLPSDSNSSVISPLTLPRGTYGYFDQVPNKTAQISSTSIRQSSVYSPPSSGVRGPPLRQFLSPHFGPTARNGVPQHRSSSLPPTHRDPVADSNRPRTNTATTARSIAHLGLTQVQMTNGAPSSAPGIFSNGAPPMGHLRTMAVESPGAQSNDQAIRRLVQQNGRIREAWEAERKYLEANRERAEEVYKEERALMEEERAEWEAERAVLLTEIERLQQQISTLGGRVGRPRDGGNAAKSSKTALHSTQSLRGGGGWDTSPESLRSSTSSQGNGPRNGEAMRNTVTLSHAQTDGLANRGLVSTEGSVFHAASSTGLPAVPEDESGPVPVVDVQEIHPELEGIPIKANTIQKPTFTFTGSPTERASGSSSRTSSPPSSSNRPKISSQGSNEQTLQVLAAEESARLTMHAGHTPSHSLSLIPTVSSSGAHTASSSGESTPTMSQADGAVNQETIILTTQKIRVRGAESLIAPAYPDPLAEYHHDPEPVHEAADDRELKGPLMVRNMPAHDEIFFRRLSDKLEEVIKDDQAALPAVLKDLAEEAEPTEQAKPDAPAEEAKQEKATGEQGGVSGAVSDSGSTEKSQSSPKSDEEAELDIPLKIKSSMNFGAPFGTFR